MATKTAKRNGAPAQPAKPQPNPTVTGIFQRAEPKTTSWSYMRTGSKMFVGDYVYPLNALFSDPTNPPQRLKITIEVLPNE